MPYVIIKETTYQGQKLSILVNDDEGVPYEFETFESANKIAKLFETNSMHQSKYTVKEINSGTPV
jgi:hypothetical protein